VAVQMAITLTFREGEGMTSQVTRRRFEWPSKVDGSLVRFQNATLYEFLWLGPLQEFLIQLVLELRPLELVSRSLECRGNISLFEDVAILQFLLVWALGKTLLQCLKSFCTQRTLARWTSNGDRPRDPLNDGSGVR